MKHPDIRNLRKIFQEYPEIQAVYLFGSALQGNVHIVQRMNSTVAIFYVLSLLRYAKGRLAGQGREKWELFGGCMLFGSR